MPKAAGAGNAGAPFQLPADLATHTADQLAELLAAANGELDSILAERNAERLPRAGELSAARKTILARQAELQAEQAKIEADFQAIADELAEQAPEEGEGQSGEVVEGEVVEETAPAAGAAPATPQLVSASGRPQGGAVTASRDTGGLAGPSHQLNPSLSGARAAAPTVMTRPAEAPLAITASVGLPGQFEVGASIASISQLGMLAEKRARSLPAGRAVNRKMTLAEREEAANRQSYGGTQIASIRNDYGSDVFSDKSSQDAVSAYIDRIQGNRSASKFESLVAAGGWCAPSQIRYDFFNIAAECGMIDLPTFGVERGGIQFPVSPSLADTFSPALPWYTAFGPATVPWLWTEASDILAATGSPTKPCIRVPCSTMSNVRLECYGICLTAGNLADNAWPESTRNFLRLLMSAHYHASNARYISSIASLATSVLGCTVTGSGAAAPLLSTAELAAIDYRSKFGMCDTDVLEVILPEWSLGLVRADLAKRTGVSDFMCVSNAQIADWFSCRGIRAQFVQDYQVRAAGQPGASTPITTYPTNFDFLIYAAGTVARGNGMALDLGVVRDSTLNALNDFTAAWMEECHLIAKFGHEVRRYTVSGCPDGTTGAADLTSCCP